MSELPVVVVNGPTASGKTAIGVDLAVRLSELGQPAEIVNADSMLVYRGMDIGTAKPTLAERRGIPHHLIDIMAITDEASVADFQRLARAVIADCRVRGVIPILVGGSALYVRAIVDVLEFPGTDPAVRARWEARLAEVGPNALHAELAVQAPEVASHILPGNGRRIVRALEVLELTGEFRPVIPEGEYALTGVVQVGLTLPRAEMDERIETRVHQMWAAGLVDEVRSLAAIGLRDGRTASRALGYRQVLAFLDGELTQPEAKQATINGTRRFARKQLMWFKRDPRVFWVAAGPAASDEVLAFVRDTLN